MKLETLDARVKLLMLLALSTASVFIRRPFTLLALLLFTAAILLCGGVHPARTLRRIRTALRLIASLFVLQCLFNRSGAPLLSLRGFPLITRGGMEAAFVVSLRLLILLLSALMILTGSRRDYLLALRQFALPYELSFMVMAGLRFLPLLREEAQDVLSAVQMRGISLKHSSLRSRLGVYLRVTVPVVAGAIRRSEQMSIAMEARAFRAMPARTSMRRLSMGRQDWLCFAIFTVLFLLIIISGGLL